MSQVRQSPVLFMSGALLLSSVRRKKRYSRWGAIVFVFSTCLQLGGCHQAPGVRNAKEGDWPGLRETISDTKLRPKQVRSLAAEVLSTEIEKAKDRQDRTFIHSLGACALPVSQALHRRSKIHDGVGAEAALLLLESGNLERSSVAKYEQDKDGAWRAVFARATVKDLKKRRSFFIDPDERIRRAALSAAHENPDDEDVASLLEVSRLDPDPFCRSRALSTLGKIGGQRVSQALKDRYPAASEAIRLAIVDAWGQKALYHAGGQRELLRLIETSRGYEALHAASILSRDKEERIRNQALTRLIRFTKEGTEGERRLAARMLPIERAATVPRLKSLSRDEDEQVAVIAWARLVAHPSHQLEAQLALLKWAESDSVLAYQARAALAAFGDQQVLPFMTRQAKSDDAMTRQVAGYGLLRLGAFSEVAQLLADEEAGVRRTIACKILARPFVAVQKR